MKRPFLEHDILSLSLSSPSCKLVAEPPDIIPALKEGEGLGKETSHVS